MPLLPLAFSTCLVLSAAAVQRIPDWVSQKAAAAGMSVPADAWALEERADGWSFLTNATPALVPGADVRVQFLVDAMAVGEIGMTGVLGASFAGAEGGTTLTATGKASVFRLRGDDTSKWRFAGIRFVGAGEVGGAPQHGGAIDCNAGALEILGCSFENFVSRQSGGAVSARFLTGDSTVSNCTFSGNCSGPFNGYGGALYLSAAEGADVWVDVLDSAFTNNSAENGGAIDTLCRDYEYGRPDEVPVSLRVAGGSAFVSNRAIFGGGAIMDEGFLRVEGTGTVFRANAAGYDGGAIAVNGVIGEFAPVDVILTNGVTFADNRAGTNTWTTGGAISLVAPGCLFKAYGATFTNNAVRVVGSSVFADGGAVYVAEDSTSLFLRCAFVDNFVEAGVGYGYGGSIATAGGAAVVDTCVFDCGANAKSGCYGGAVDFSETAAVMRNTTVRRARVEGVSAYLSSLAVTNCVLVGNGIDCGGTDLFLQEMDGFTTAYSAYGKLARDASSMTLEELGAEFCLGNRTTEIYDGDALRLDGTRFNPVAGLGLSQGGVTDFVDVLYGSRPWGSSMGAYETPTPPLRVTLDGSKTYDGNTTSNACEWTWSLTETNGMATGWGDLLDPSDDTRRELPQVFALESWAFAESDVGYYASTNAAPARRIDAEVKGVSRRVEWLRTLLEFVYTGTIGVASDIALIFSPNEYAWTGGPITPTNDPSAGVTVIVSNRVTGAILERGVDYELGWRNNVDPTDAAKIDVNGINNYAGAQIASNFLITAYCTKYFMDVDTANPEPYEVVTNGALSGAEVVAAIDVPPGYCIDWQWPLKTGHQTNGVEHVYGRGGSGKESILTLWVDYEKDANVPGGDDVPDKYQERVIFAVVNGWWNGERNGADKVGWVTLYDGEGKWATDGTGHLSDIPGVGDKPFSSFVTGEANGQWNQDLASAIDRSTFPIFLFGYGRDERPSDPGRNARPFLLAATRGRDAAAASPTQNALLIADFKVEGADAVSGAVKAAVIDRATGATLATTELAGRNVTIYGAESPDGAWKPVSTPRTDAEGGWAANRLRSFRFFKAVLEEQAD